MKNFLIALFLCASVGLNSASYTQPTSTSLKVQQHPTTKEGIYAVKLVDENGNTGMPYSGSQVISGSNNGAAISVNGGSIVSLYISNMTGGAIFPQVSNDGTNFASCYDEIRTYGVRASRISSISASGAYTVNIAGWKYFRLSATSLSTPITAAINISGSSNTGTLENINDYADSISRSAASTAAFVGAAPAGTANDNVYVRQTCTAGTFLHMSITANTGAYYHTYLASPGAGLKYRIKRYRFAMSGNCTGNNALTVALASNGAAITGTQYYPLVPAVAATNPGGWASGWFEAGQGFDYLVGSTDGSLQMYVSGTLTGSGVLSCNLVYEIIPN